MEQYLLFDAHCSVCRQLACTIEVESKGKLRAVGLHETQAKAMLDQAFPNGWEHAPYLVTVSRDGIWASKGLGLAIRLAWLLGPREAWKIWQLANDSRTEQLATHNSINYSSRRWFLKGGILALAAALTSQIIRPSSVAFACVPCETCGCHWVFNTAFCYGNCDPYTGDTYAIWYCIDNQSGEECDMDVRFVSSCSCGTA